VNKRFITYGLSAQADIRACDVKLEGFTTTFTTQYRGERLGEISFNMPGAHNVLNALAAIGVALELGVSFGVIQEGFRDFGGVGRRFQVKGEVCDIMVVDDYGHHPAEIRATLAAGKSGWDRRLVVLFQPHRYTRTKELYDDFVKAFHDAEVLVLTDIYPAGEEPIEGITAEALARSIKQHGQKDVIHIADRDEVVDHLLEVLQPGDIFLTLGAGNVWQTGELLLRKLGKEL
nr:cyanophycin synthetase [Geobacteraceae bacterium]